MDLLTTNWPDFLRGYEQAALIIGMILMIAILIATFVYLCIAINKKWHL